MLKKRKSIRLDGFDYSQSGMYFVTIDVQDKLKLFWGEINLDYRYKGGHIGPPVHEINQIGKNIDYWWNEISNHFPNVFIDEYVIMSDHIHGMLIIKNNMVGVDRCVDPKLGDIIQWFKTMTTNEYIRNVKDNNWPRFFKRLWQRNYYERIIRNKREYLGIKKYIRNNPNKFITKTPSKEGVLRLLRRSTFSQ